MSCNAFRPENSFRRETTDESPSNLTMLLGNMALSSGVNNIQATQNENNTPSMQGFNVRDRITNDQSSMPLEQVGQPRLSLRDILAMAQIIIDDLEVLMDEDTALERAGESPKPDSSKQLPQ